MFALYLLCMFVKVVFVMVLFGAILYIIHLSPKCKRVHFIIIPTYTRHKYVHNYIVIIYWMSHARQVIKIIDQGFLNDLCQNSSPYLLSKPLPIHYNFFVHLYFCTFYRS